MNDAVPGSEVVRQWSVYTSDAKFDQAIVGLCERWGVTSACVNAGHVNRRNGSLWSACVGIGGAMHAQEEAHEETGQGAGSLPPPSFASTKRRARGLGGVPPNAYAPPRTSGMPPSRRSRSRWLAALGFSCWRWSWQGFWRLAGGYGMRWRG